MMMELKEGKMNCVCCCDKKCVCFLSVIVYCVVCVCTLSVMSALWPCVNAMSGR